MHLRSSLPRIAAIFLLIVSSAFLLAQQPPANSQNPPAQNQASASASPQAQQPAAAPGVHREGTDNILVDANGVPLEDQSGNSIAAQPPAEEEAATE